MRDVVKDSACLSEIRKVGLSPATSSTPAALLVGTSRHEARCDEPTTGRDLHRDAGETRATLDRQSLSLPTWSRSFHLGSGVFYFPRTRGVKAGETPHHLRAAQVHTLSRLLLAGGLHSLSGQTGAGTTSGDGSCASLYQVEHRILSFNSRIWADIDAAAESGW